MPCSALFSGGDEFGCVTDKALANRQTGLSRQFKNVLKKFARAYSEFDQKNAAQHKFECVSDVMADQTNWLNSVETIGVSRLVS
jgi:hypothetical protein